MWNIWETQLPTEAKNATKITIKANNFPVMDLDTSKYAMSSDECYVIRNIYWDAVLPFLNKALPSLATNMSDMCSIQALHSTDNGMVKFQWWLLSIQSIFN